MIALWIIIGILSGLLVAALAHISTLQRSLRLRTEYLYALIGDRHEDVVAEVASARAALGENLRRADELGFGEWVAEEERRAD